MSRNPFLTRLRDHTTAVLGKPGDHDRLSIADGFLEANPELAAAYMRTLLAKHVADLVKDLCDEPADFGQLDLFNGLPIAVTIADGVVKAAAHCTLDDLGAGLEYRRLNLTRAQDKLRKYEYSMAAFQELRERDESRQSVRSPNGFVSSTRPPLRLDLIVR